MALARAWVNDQRRVALARQVADLGCDVHAQEGTVPARKAVPPQCNALREIGKIGNTKLVLCYKFCGTVRQ